MNAIAPYLLVYIAGIATPILFVRQLLRARGDEGACLLEITLTFLFLLFIATLTWSFGR